MYAAPGQDELPQKLCALRFDVLCSLRGASSQDALGSENSVLVTSRHNFGSVIKSENNYWHRQCHPSRRNVSGSEGGGGLVEQEGTLPSALALPLTSSAFMGKAVLAVLRADGLIMKGEWYEIVEVSKG